MYQLPPSTFTSSSSVYLNFGRSLGLLPGSCNFCILLPLFHYPPSVFKLSQSVIILDYISLYLLFVNDRLLTKKETRTQHEHKDITFFVLFFFCLCWHSSSVAIWPHSCVLPPCLSPELPTLIASGTLASLDRTDFSILA